MKSSTVFSKNLAPMELLGSSTIGNKAFRPRVPALENSFPVIASKSIPPNLQPACTQATETLKPPKLWNNTQAADVASTCFNKP
jgi:hypothetical protein